MSLAEKLTHSNKTMPITCFGSLAQRKIPTPAAIQILIYLPMFGLTRNQLTTYGYTVVFKLRCFGM